MPDSTTPDILDPGDLPDELWARLLRAADDPWEVEAPSGFDFVEAKERFLLLVQAVERVVGPAGDVEVWPLVRGATFHGAVQLPPASLRPEGAASVRVSNFGNFATIHPVDEAIATPDVAAGLRRAIERKGYRYVPTRVLRRPYTGHHMGKAPIADWLTRFFDYL
jgi:hypothetical protein